MTARIDHRALMAAVLDRAVRDVRETWNLPAPISEPATEREKGRNAHGRGLFYLGTEVREWFASDGEGLFSFIGICDALGVNAGMVRGTIASFLPFRHESEWREHVAPRANYRKSA
jgi:hypothetical protein